MVARETSTSEEKYKVKVHVGSRADKHDRYCKRLANQEAFEMLERSKFKLKNKCLWEERNTKQPKECWADKQDKHDRYWKRLTKRGDKIFSRKKSLPWKIPKTTKRPQIAKITKVILGQN